MSSFLEEPLPNCINVNVLIRVLFTIVIFILPLASASSQFALSSKVATPPSSVATLMGREAEALLEWKASLDNQSQFLLSSWVGNITCHWVGISCNNFSRISHVNLTGVGLKGTLYSFSFSTLHSLLSIDLGNNKFHGEIPSHLGNLSALIYLDLSHNRLSGIIPPVLSNITSLVVLKLNENRFGGAIPHQIGNLSNLIYMDLGLNKLSGSIPQELGKLTSLSKLFLDDNILTGMIPTSIGNLSNLSVLYLHNNKFSGPIPQEIGKLGSLRELSLYNNDFRDDRIPNWIWDLNLTNLNSPYRRAADAPAGAKR